MKNYKSNKNQQHSVNSFTGANSKALSNLPRNKSLPFNKKRQTAGNRSRHSSNRRFGNYNKPRAAVGRWQAQSRHALNASRRNGRKIIKKRSISNIVQLLGGGIENYKEIKYFDDGRRTRPTVRPTFGGRPLSKARRWETYLRKSKIDERRKRILSNKGRFQFKHELIKVFGQSPLSFLAGLADKGIYGNLKAKKIYFKFALPGLTIGRGFVNRTEAQFVNWYKLRRKRLLSDFYIIFNFKALFKGDRSYNQYIYNKFAVYAGLKYYNNPAVDLFDLLNRRIFFKNLKTTKGQERVFNFWQSLYEPEEVFNAHLTAAGKYASESYLYRRKVKVRKIVYPFYKNHLKVVKNDATYALPDFFYNAALVHLVRSLYSKSFAYFMRLIAVYMLELSKNSSWSSESKKKLFGSRGLLRATNSSFDEEGLTVGDISLFLLAGEAVSSGGLGNNKSPFLGPKHLLWAKNTIARDLREGVKPSNNRNYRVIGRSIYKTILFNKKSFFSNKVPGSADFVYRHVKYANVVISSIIRGWKRKWRSVKKKKMMKRYVAFKVKRAARQASKDIYVRMDNTAPWLFYVADRPARTIDTMGWNPILKREMEFSNLFYGDKVKLLDKEGGVSVNGLLAPLNKSSAEPVNLKTLFRAFSGIFITQFASRIEKNRGANGKILISSKAKIAYYNELRILVEKFVKSTSAQYNDATRNFTLTLKAANSLRRFNMPFELRKNAKNENGFIPTFKKSGAYVIADGDVSRARGYPSAISLSLWFKRYWGDGTVLERPFRPVFDVRTNKFMGGLDYVSNRYLVGADYSTVNFSSYCSTNKTAFIKLIVSSVSSTAGENNFRPEPTLVSSTVSRAIKAAANDKLLRAIRRFRDPVFFASKVIRRYFILNKQLSRRGHCFNFYSTNTDYFVSGAKERATFPLLSQYMNLNMVQASSLTGAAKKLYIALYLIKTFKSSINRPSAGWGVLSKPRSFYLKQSKGFVNKSSGRRKKARPSRHIMSLHHTRMLKIFFDHIGSLVDYGAGVNISTEQTDRFITDVGFSHKRVILNPKGYMFKHGKIPPRRFKHHYAYYVYRHIYARRARELLLDGYYGNSSLVDRSDVAAILPRMHKEQKKLVLYKFNPEAEGRSRAIYYVQKKGWRFRKWNKRYSTLQFHQPHINMTTAKYLQNARNTYLMDQHAKRVGVTKKFLKLKHCLRHSMRRHYSCSNATLFYRWKRIKENKNKWLFYYYNLEAGLANYIWLCRLVKTKELARRFIEGGLIRVNTEVCVNVDYIVRPGDVITMNNRAYWHIVSRLTSKYLKRALGPSDAPHNAKRAAMDRALRIIQKRANFGVTAAVKDSSEKETLDKAKRLFSDTSAMGYNKKRKKPYAPGAAVVSRYDVFNAGINRFGIRPLPDEDIARLRYRLFKLMKKWDTSMSFSGGFYYRFYNTVMAIREPVSAKEMFSASKRRMSDLYNPFAIRTFYNHLYWR